MTNFDPTSEDEEFTADASQARESKYVIPDGWYDGVITNVERSVSNAGNPMYVWHVAGTSGPAVDMSFRVYTALTNDAIWKLLEMVTAIGIPVPADKKISFKKRDVVAKRLQFSTKVEEYNGKKRSSLAEVRPHPDGAEKLPF